MKYDWINIIKASGEKTPFAIERLENSLKSTGADDSIVQQVLDKVVSELYEGISTKEIYNRAFLLLKKNKSYLASKYKLKKAIYELGPSGFPFERFISEILKYSGYSTEVGTVLRGRCVTHEIDVIAKKNKEVIIVECKFHSDQGLKSNIKIPLYINSRYHDVRQNWANYSKKYGNLKNCWIVTNTRFTSDALKYGACAGLYLLSWDYPKKDALKDRIDRLGLYPITVSTFLTEREKRFLLNKDVVLCRELVNHVTYLNELNISELRKEKILGEIKSICKRQV
jgi:Holliday junction resolvase-like predicted endonuclease